MKTAIITAMKEEADYIIKQYNLKEVKKFHTLTIFENESIILALAGIGKIQASIGTTYILENYKINKLINIGIAGSLLGNKAKIGDVFFLSKITQHDMYLPFDGSHLDYAKKEIIINSKININISDFSFGVIQNAHCLTGDQFMDNTNKILELAAYHKAGVIEMEAFAIASVAREFKVLDNCIFLKAISDGADNDSKDAHMGNLDFAMKNSLEVLAKILLNRE